MAWRDRRGLTGALLGSETVKVLIHSQMAVLVYR
jgi:nucleotide-binding universal stress UspA family protein